MQHLSLHLLYSSLLPLLLLSLDALHSVITVKTQVISHCTPTEAATEQLHRIRLSATCDVFM